MILPHVGWGRELSPSQAGLTIGATKYRPEYFTLTIRIRAAGGGEASAGPPHYGGFIHHGAADNHRVFLTSEPMVGSSRAYQISPDGASSQVSGISSASVKLPFNFSKFGILVSDFAGS